MDSATLKAFLAVAETQSFSAAAKRLYLTQPAISKRIAQLEGELGHPLFDRQGRLVSLTEAGQTLLPRARGILLAIEDSRRAIQDLSSAVSGPLRAAISHHVGLHHLPPILRAFIACYPKVDLHFQFLDSELTYDKVLRGECEFALATMPDKLNPVLDSEIIWVDSLSVVSSISHTLSQDKTVNLQQLSAHPCILPNLATITGKKIKALFDAENLHLRCTMATNYLETIKALVSVGLGWSVLPKSMLDTQLHEMHIKNFTLSRNLGLITHKKRSLSNAANAFIDVLRVKK